MNKEEFERAFLDDLIAEKYRAEKKFPTNEHLLIALGEEYGELCQAFLHLTEKNGLMINCYVEAVQVAAVAMRIALEGSSGFPYTNPTEL